MRKITVGVGLLFLSLQALSKNPIVLTSKTSPTVLASYTQPANQSGRLDQTFAVGGIAQKNISGYNDSGNAVALQSDGKIVVAGVTNINGTVVAPFATPTGVFVTARYTTNGSLDSSFGNGAGYVTTSFSGGGYVDGAYGVAVQSDGKIVVVGQTNIYGSGAGTGSFGIIRYNQDGSPDTTFGPNGNGTVTKNISGAGVIDGATCVVIQPDGNIVVGGATNIASGGLHTGSMAVLRYTSAGIPDTSFGTNGVFTVKISPAGEGDIIYALLLQPDGKIIGVGGTNFAETGTIAGDYALIRLNTNGTLDTTFGGNHTGIVTTALSGHVAQAIDTASGAALQSDGKIVVTGGKNRDAAGGGSPGVAYVATVRYNSDGSLDASFGTAGVVTVNISGVTQADAGYAVAIQPDAKIIIVGTTNIWDVVPAATGGVFLIRYNQNGSYDTTFGTAGIVNTKISPTGQRDAGYAGVLQSNGKIVAVGATNVSTAPGNILTIRYINPFTFTSFSESYGAVGMV